MRRRALTLSAVGIALALAACAGDEVPITEPAVTTPSAAAPPVVADAAAPGGAPSAAPDAEDNAPAAPSIVRKSAAVLATPTPAPTDGRAEPSGEEPASGLALLQRFFEAVTAPAAPATEAAPAAAAAPDAKAPDAGAPAAPPDRPPVPLTVETPAAAPAPARPEAPPQPSPESPRAVAALAPPASPRPPGGASARPNAGACAEVTANGPAREVDLDAVRRLLRGPDYRRGSFETNAAYRGRLIVKLEAVAALIAEQTGRDELVFSLPVPDYRVSYDDEAHELWVGSELGLLRGGSAIGMGDFILVSAAERQIGRHLSTIAYGTRRVPAPAREVARVVGDQLGLIVPGGSSIGWPANFQRLHLPVSAAEAAAAKGALAVLFVARLQEPYFITGEFVQEAKLDDPVEKRLTVEALKIAIDCAALYDRRSGRVLKTLVPAGG